MMSGSKCSAVCMTSKIILAVLLFLTTLASLLGVYQTHFVGGSMQFGSTSGSLAIIAFVASALAWGKKMKCCMMNNCEVCMQK